jgi:hypothetical protein
LNYYIYYRSALPALQLVERVRAMHKELQTRCDVSARFFQQAADPTLWMEVYEDVQDESSFEAELTRLLSKHGIDQALAPNETRHIEKFIAR